MSDSSNLKISARDVNVFYGEKQAIRDVSIDIATEHVTAFIGPSGCGKSTFLRTLNRMNDTIAGCRIEGEIKLDGADIYSSGIVFYEMLTGRLPYEGQNPVSIAVNHIQGGLVPPKDLVPENFNSVDAIEKLVKELVEE